MRTYRRWDVGLATALVLGLAGVLVGSATVLAAGVVGLTFAAYGYATRPPDATILVRRRVDEEEPTPGERVEVTVEVENASEAPVAELRVVDEPPADLPLVEGTPADCTSLRPGETERFEYAVRARRGSHAFGDASVLLRNVSGTVERLETHETATELTCRVGLAEMPLTAQTTPYDGRVDADAPGEGVAFHSTRQFHPSDPLYRVDWKRFAKTGELTTVQFQATRAATVVLLVDARPGVRVARRPDEHDAVQFCGFAAGRIADVLLAASNRVGVALYGATEYLRPGVGRDQRVRVRRFLREGLEAASGSADGDRPSIFDVDRVFFGGMDDADHGPDDAASPDPPGVPPNLWADGGGSVAWLDQRLPDDAQVVFCTPLLDEAAADAARRLEARGHSTTVVSPDVTSTGTPGGVVEAVRRRQRVGSLRPDARVVDWSPDEPLAAAVSRAQRRWAR